MKLFSTNVQNNFVICKVYLITATKSEKIDSHFAIYYNNMHPKVYKNPKVHYYFNPAGGTIVQEDFWNFLGKNSQTYTSLTKLFESYGKTNKKKIWEGFSKLIDIK
jgi:hypothetical protein